VGNRAFSKGSVPHVCHAPKNFELPRRAGPHLLDRLLDRVDRPLDRVQRVVSVASATL
jgi:hypothetical protein